MRRSEVEVHFVRGHPVAIQKELKQKSKRKMKCLISLGLLLPVVAGVIGVAAWTVNAEVVMGRAREDPATSWLMQDSSGTIRMTDKPEKRLNQEYAVAPIITVTVTAKPVSPSPGKDDKEQYFVHFVIEDKNNTKPNSGELENYDGGQDEEDLIPINNDFDITSLISKIITASRNVSTGAPQYVVFAPSPTKDKLRAQTLSSQLETPWNVNEDNSFQDKAPFKPQKNDDLQMSSSNIRKGHVSHSTSRNQQQGFGPNRSGEQPFVPIVYSNSNSNHGQSSDFSIKQSSSSYSGSIAPYPPAPPVHAAPNYHPPAPAHHNSRSGYNHQQGFYLSSHPKQTYDGNTWVSRDDYRGYEGSSSYGRGYGGYVPSKGINIHLSGGGGHSPLGSLSSLLLPSLGKPKVNLNGRVVFGVVLDKGIGLGGGGKTGYGGYSG
ncbi:uncharacterized protein LOC143235186 [Tachypleus tridentatus]|uniref:uncharacterized protein LOC143235186 n=1 Tax=Tachypleus tridentatus TaxID=6853 RepID=UPI003FD2566D